MSHSSVSLIRKGWMSAKAQMKKAKYLGRASEVQALRTVLVDPTLLTQSGMTKNGGSKGRMVAESILSNKI